MEAIRECLMSMAVGRWFWHTLRDPFPDACQPAWRTRVRRRSKLARPNICRFNILILLTVPTTRPELWGRVRPAWTAS